MRARLLAAVSLGVVLLLLYPTAASAAWITPGTATAAATATVVDRAQAPTATRVRSAVRLDWPAVTLAQGTPVTGYTVLRHAGQGSAVEICTTVAPTRTCTDSAPVVGTVSYGVVARFRSWTGQEGALTSFTYDAAPPVTEIQSSPAPTAAGWNSTAVTLTLTAVDEASDVASVTYRVGDSSPVTVSGSSASLPVSAPGQTTITYFATDTVGNVETPQAYTVNIDTVTPNAPSLLSMSSDSGPADRVTNVATQTLSGTAEPGSTVTVRGGSTTFPTTVAAADGTFSLSATLPEGVNNLTATATDPAGNTSPASAPFMVTLDTVIPTVVTTDPKNATAYRDSSGPQGARWANTCAGKPGACGTTADAGSGIISVALRLRDTATNTCWTGTGTTYAACGSSLAVTGITTWSRAIAYSAVTGRSLRLTVTVTDLAGNVGIQTVTFSAE